MYQPSIMVKDFKNNYHNACTILVLYMDCFGHQFWNIQSLILCQMCYFVRQIVLYYKVGQGFTSNIS